MIKNILKLLISLGFLIETIWRLTIVIMICWIFESNSNNFIGINKWIIVLTGIYYSFIPFLKEIENNQKHTREK